MFAFIVFALLLATVSLFIGLSVFIRNQKNPVNTIFFILCVIAAVWASLFVWTFYLFSGSASSSNSQLLDILNRLSYLAGFLLITTMAIFSYFFPIKRSRKPLIIFSVPLLLVAILSLTPFVAGYVEITNGQYEITNGSLTWLYLAFMLAGLTVILYNLASHQNKLTKTQKSQNKLLSIGFVTSVFMGLILALLIPTILPESRIDLFSPIALLFFLIPVAMAIKNFQLFDFRSVLARSLAYVLSLGLITVLISVLIYGLSTTVRGAQVSDSVQSLIYVAVTLVLVLSYSSLKKFFDRITNSLFYRDAYDAEQFIGQLNQAVVSDIEIYSLLRKVIPVIEQNIKVTYSSFATVSHLGQVILVSDDPDERQDLTKLDIKLFREANANKKVIVTDYLDEQKDMKLKSHLLELDMGAIITLVSKKSNEPELFNKVYLILGRKKSGNPFTSQDVRVLEIISNSLALAIQNALRFEEISRFNITLQEKIDEATRELQRTNEKLRALDEAKDEFISMASHQLRTPLTSVKGYVSMVLEGDTGAIKANQRKLLQQAFDSSQRMVYLIADLLNVSRLRTGKFVIENRETNLADVVSGEVDQLKETAHNKKIKLTYDKPSKFPAMMLDETKIRQVVMNYLDNALYYTPSGGEVTVSLTKEKDSIEYKVTDTGVGVPKSEQHHLFTKFYRAGNARKMRPDGTGLGLYMAQKVVVAQGGAVIFESEEGKGSTFGFSFPLKTVASPKAITD